MYDKERAYLPKSKRQWFSKCSFWTRGPGSASPGNLSDLQILGPHPVLLSQTLRLGPATCAPTNLPGYFSACSRLRITSIGKAGQERNERKVKSADSSKVSEP